MIIIIFGIAIASFALFFFEAKWDAEAFKEGESNHKFKRYKLISMYFVIGFVAMVIYQCGLSQKSTWDCLFVLFLCISIPIFTRVYVFDNALNHFRDKPFGYKSIHPSLQGLSLLAVFVIVTILFKIL